jgi:hypothetical protein
MNVKYRNLLILHPLPTEDTSKEGKVVMNVILATGRNRQCLNTKSHTTCKGAVMMIQKWQLRAIMKFPHFSLRKCKDVSRLGKGQFIC